MDNSGKRRPFYNYVGHLDCASMPTFGLHEEQTEAWTVQTMHIYLQLASVFGVEGRLTANAACLQLNPKVLRTRDRSCFRASCGRGRIWQNC